MVKKGDQVEQQWLEKGSATSEELWVTGSEATAVVHLRISDITVGGERSGGLRWLAGKTRELAQYEKGQGSGAVVQLREVVATGKEHIVSATEGGHVSVWTETDGKWQQSYSCDAHTGAVRGVVVLYRDDVQDTLADREVAMHHGFDPEFDLAATSTALQAEGPVVVTAGEDGRILVHRPFAEGHPAPQVLREAGPAVLALEADDATHVFASGHHEGALHLWSGLSLRLLHRFVAPADTEAPSPLTGRSVTHLAFSEGNGRWLAVGTSAQQASAASTTPADHLSGTVSLWDTFEFRLLRWRVLSLPSGETAAAKAMPIRHLAVAGSVAVYSSGDAMLHFWSEELSINCCIETAAPVTALAARRVVTTAPHPTNPEAVVRRISAARDFVVSGHDNGFVCVWNAWTQHCELRMEGHRSAVLSLDVLRGVAATGSTDQTLRVWRIAAAELVDSSDAENAEGVQSAAVLRQKGNKAYKENKLEEALSHYTHALNLNSLDPALLSNRAACKFHLGDYAGCISDCKSGWNLALRLGGGDVGLIVKICIRLGEAYVAQNELENGLTWYERAHFIIPDQRVQEKIEQTKKKQQAHAFVVEGVKLLGSGRHGEAVCQYAQAALVDETYDIRFGLAKGYFGMGRHEKALADAKLAVGLAHSVEQRADAHELCGDILVALNRAKEAISEFQAAQAEISRQRVVAKLDAAWEQRSKSEDAGAVAAEREKELQERRDRAKKLKEQGNTYYNEKNTRAALECYTKAIDLSPEPNIVLFSNRSAVYFLLKSFNACVEDCEHALAAAETAVKIPALLEKSSLPSLKAKIHNRMAQALIELGSHGAAAGQYKDAIKETRTLPPSPAREKQLADLTAALDKLSVQPASKSKTKTKSKSTASEPAAAPAPAVSEFDPIREEHANGDRCLQSQNFKDAVSFYTRTVEMAKKLTTVYPDMAQLFLAQATAHLMNKQYTESLDSCNSCLKISPTNVEALLLRGNLLSQNKRYTDALLSYVDAHKLDPANTRIGEAIKPCLLLALTSDRADRAGLVARHKYAETHRDAIMGDAAVQAALTAPDVQAVLRAMSHTDMFVLVREISSAKTLAHLAVLYTAGVLLIPIEKEEQSVAPSARKKGEGDEDEKVGDWWGKKPKTATAAAPGTQTSSVAAPATASATASSAADAVPAGEQTRPKAQGSASKPAGKGKGKK
eukprot:TRINITY_DN1240_c0_g1_i1.p1 TRINITY_DN1240_c0_g1~~TRINITY_DN1240_c0_g1_i1.p1  ORF type:complete len:1204 (-),score=302.48 TRINITY_DN1240_c0_g1_i1:52-3621(-)